MNNIELASKNGRVFRYEISEKDAHLLLITDTVVNQLGLSWQPLTTSCRYCGRAVKHARYFANISSVPGIVGQHVNVCERDIVIAVSIDMSVSGRLHIRRTGEQILSV